jgi:hypothetical protein
MKEAGGGSQEALKRMAAVLGNREAFQGFVGAATDDREWERATDDPAAYLEARGIDLSQVDVRFTEHDLSRPWPRPGTDIELVKVRCWWVWGKVDPDEDAVPPFRFCLEVPAALLPYLRGR